MFAAVSVCITLLCILIYSSPLYHRIVRKLHDYKSTIGAKALDRFQVLYNARMKHRKEILIRDELQRLCVQGGSTRKLKIVEIGAGCGANFEFFPSEVDVTCVEPNERSEIMLRRNAKRFPGVRVEEFLVVRAEDMSSAGIEKESVDAVICTLVLCSVDNVHKCLDQVLKILRPGGQFIFLEHIGANRSSSTTARIFQKFFKYPWRLLCDCDVTRMTHDVIRNAPFSRVEMEMFNATELIEPTAIFPLVSAMTPHIMGIATK